MRDVLSTVAVVLGGLLVVPASAVDVPLASKKLVVVDTLSARSKAKVLYVAKDKAAGITKGNGTDVGQIAARFAFRYGPGGGSATGAFIVPAGASGGGAGWKTNTEKVAKYLNKGAPGGPTQAKLALVKPGKMLKLVGKGLGDESIDVLGAGAPTSVFTSYCITNGSDETCHCSEFMACTYKRIARESGAKLVCKRAVGDGECTAGATATPSTTTTTMPPCRWTVLTDFESGSDFTRVVGSGVVLYAWLDGTPNSVTLTVSGPCAGEFCVYRVGDASQASIDEAQMRAATNDVSGLTPLSCGPATGSQTFPTDSSYVYVVTAQ